MTLPIRALAPRFDPRRIADCRIWLDPSVSSSLTIETGVAEWRNLAALGGAFAQSTGNNQPTLTDANSAPAVINGRQALFFDGTNDRLDAPAGNVIRQCLSSAPGASCYAVIRPAGTTYRDVIALRDNGRGFVDFGQDTRLYFGTKNATGTYTVRQSATGVISANTTYVIGLRFNALAPESTADLNRTTVLSRSSLAGVADSFGAGAMGGAFTIGFFNLNSHFSGLVGEILLYSRDLSAAEHSAIMEYLIAKWGA